MNMSEFLNMDMGEVSDWMIENSYKYTVIKNEDYNKLVEALEEVIGDAYNVNSEMTDWSLIEGAQDILLELGD